MAKRLYPHNHVKYAHSYDLDEICLLFKNKGLHIQTIRKWINKDGLETIDKGKPSLVYGYDLIQFLKKQNDKGKCKTDFKEMYCMKCKDARPILKKTIQITKTPNRFQAKGHCRQCKIIMNKTYKFEDFQKLMRMFIVVEVEVEVEVLELYDCEKPTSMTHFRNHINLDQNESLQGDLFQ